MHYTPNLVVSCFTFIVGLCTSTSVLAYQQSGQLADDQSSSESPQENKFNSAVCLAPPIPALTMLEPPTESGAIHIQSQTAQVLNNAQTRFTGDVLLFENNQRIKADVVNVDRLEAIINASGNIHFQNADLNVFADSLKGADQLEAAELQNTAYSLNGRPGQGDAERLIVYNTGAMTLKSANFTTCPDLENADWKLTASEINIDVAENSGEAFNARFKIADIPVFYMPYFSFPVTDKRKSGFLFPKIASSSNSGLEISTPYYINLAPNYDATITPYYMSNRGLQLKTELRYLVDQQQGMVHMEYLNKDDEIKSNDDARYLFRVQHVGNFAENFRGYIDYTTISDENYFVDLRSEHYNSNDTSLSKVGELSYFTDNWRTTVKLQSFDVLGDYTESPKTLPHVEVEGHVPVDFLSDTFATYWDVYSEVTRFENKDESSPEANRMHIESGLTLPYSSPATFFTAEAKLLYTYYDQDNIEDYSFLDSSVSRTLPKVRLHTGINLERDTELFSTNLTQTLEPQIQYLYIGEKDQSNIGVYDTTTLQDDYDGLFRDRRYSGLDRIAKANQFSVGLTSRFLSEINEELFSFSFGQIFYINDSNIDLTEQDNEVNDQSSLAAELFVQLSKRWQLNSNFQYDSENDVTEKSNVSLDYRRNDRELVHITHRYNRDVSGNTIEQASLLGTYPVSPEWMLVANYTRDLTRRRTLEHYLGAQYESCCWALRVAYHRHINSNLNEQNFIDENRDEFNSGVVLQFVFKGFADYQSGLQIEDMLDTGVFGYKRPYFLNN